MKYSRYKPKGWTGESYRHYLAAKGIPTKHRYFKFTKDTTVPNIEHPGEFKSNIRVEKSLLSPQEAEDLLSEAIGGDVEGQKKFRKQETNRMIEAYKSGKNLPAFSVYYKRQEDGSWKIDSYDRDSVLFAAIELRLDEIPVVEVFKRPYKSTGIMQGEFEFTPVEKQLAKEQERIIGKAGGFSIGDEGDGIKRIKAKNEWVLSDKERELLKDKNIRDTVVMDAVPQTYAPDESKPWWYQ